MARVFLSYARNDVGRAKPLAGALARAGHTVWWDRHIEGGSDYSREIDAALKRADAVVVLWSASSVESAWVRDEAAAGRDTGRLVPVLIEDVEPPLGFRQYQAIDLSGWKGRGQSAELKMLKNAIAGKDSRETAPETTPAAPIHKAGAGCKDFSPLAYLLFAALVLAAGVLAANQWGGKWWGGGETASLAVLPFADMSGADDQSYFAEGVAEEIRSILSEHSNIRVVGRTSSSKFSDNDADMSAIRRALGVSHILEGTVRTAGKRVRVSVSLIDTARGQQIWGQDYDRTIDDIFAVQDEIGLAVARRLEASLSSSDPSTATTAEVYARYLKARSLRRIGLPRELEQAQALLNQALRADGGYAPAWAELAQVTNSLSADTTSVGDAPIEATKATARSYAGKALALSPKLPQAHLALGAILMPRKAALEPLQKAVQLDPQNAEAWYALGNYCEFNECANIADYYRRAAAIEPLWPAPLARLARVLIEDGKHAEASDVIARFETIAHDRFEIEALKAYLAFREGEIARLITHGRAAYELRPDDPKNATWLGFGYQILGETARAVAVLPERELMSKRAFTRDYEGVAAEAIRRGPELWSRRRDARTAINVLSAQGRHSDILRLYDQRYRSLEDFVRQMPIYVSVAPELSVAFRHAGRNKEAAAILKASFRPLARHPNEWGLHSSRVLAAAGRSERALATLEEVVENDFLYISAPPFLRPSDYPLLRQMKGHPRLQQIDARYLQTINKERATLGWPPLRDYPE